MTVVYILLAALICYALLLLFRQQADLKDRITRLEREKDETEQILLRFMEQVNGMTESDSKSTLEPSLQVDAQGFAPSEQVLHSKTDPDTGQPEVKKIIHKEPVVTQEQEMTDVKQALQEGTDIETLARSLNRGTGEVALIAKLSHQTKVAPR